MREHRRFVYLHVSVPVPINHPTTKFYVPRMIINENQLHDRYLKIYSDALLDWNLKRAALDVWIEGKKCVICKLNMEFVPDRWMVTS